RELLSFVRGFFCYFSGTATADIYTLSLHDALPIFGAAAGKITVKARLTVPTSSVRATLIHSLRTPTTPNAVLSSIGHTEQMKMRSEEHTSELQSRENLVCRLLLEKKKNHKTC